MEIQDEFKKLAIEFSKAKDDIVALGNKIARYEGQREGSAVPRSYVTVGVPVIALVFGYLCNSWVNAIGQSKALDLAAPLLKTHAEQADAAKVNAVGAAQQAADASERKRPTPGILSNR